MSVSLLQCLGLFNQEKEPFHFGTPAGLIPSPDLGHTVNLSQAPGTARTEQPRVTTCKV